jgi:hypothetical protein
MLRSLTRASAFPRATFPVGPDAAKSRPVRRDVSRGRMGTGQKAGRPYGAGMGIRGEDLAIAAFAAMTGARKFGFLLKAGVP